MTVKAFVLDALSKFLTKLKSTYFTPMQGDIDTLNAHDVSDLGTAIPDNADLDAYTTPGRYYATSTASIGHFPMTGSASVSMDMIVMPRASSVRARQILFAYMSTQQFGFMRSMTGASAWGDWTRLTDTEQIYTAYATFYSAISNLAATVYNKPMLFNIAGAVSSVITGGRVTVSLRGMFIIADASQMLLDFFAMDGTNCYVHIFRTKLTSSSAATVQQYNSTSVFTDLLGAQAAALSNVNANDYKETGVFQVGNTSTVTNLPSGVGYGFLRVTRARSYRYQEYYECQSPHAVYQRRSTDNGTNWGAWVKRPTQAEVDAINTRTCSSNFKLQHFNINSSGTVITLSNSYRGFALINDTSDTRQQILAIESWSTGATSCKGFSTAAGITVTTATNKVTLSSNGTPSVLLITTQGTATI